MLRRQTVFIALAALAGLVFGQNTAPKPEVPAVVQAKSFLLLDDAGRTRGEMSINRAGKPLIQLFDERGRVIWDSTDEPKMKPLLVHPSF
jgi:hypothetical protein